MLYCALSVYSNCCWSGYHIILVMQYRDMVVLVTVSPCHHGALLCCIVPWVFTAIVVGVVTIVFHHTILWHAGVTVNPCCYGIVLCCIVLWVFTAIVVRAVTIVFCHTIFWHAGITVNPCCCGIKLCCIVLWVFVAFADRMVIMLFQPCSTVTWWCWLPSILVAMVFRYVVLYSGCL